MDKPKMKFICKFNIPLENIITILLSQQFFGLILPPPVTSTEREMKNCLTTQIEFWINWKGWVKSYFLSLVSPPGIPFGVSRNFS